MTRQELMFLLALVRPHGLDAGLFVTLSVLAALVDSVSIATLVPLLALLQGGELADGLPRALLIVTSPLEGYEPAVQLRLAIGAVVAFVLLKNVMIGVVFSIGSRLSNTIAAEVRMRLTSVLLATDIDFHYRTRIGHLLEATLGNTLALRGVILSMVQFAVFAATFLALFLVLLIISVELTLLAVVLGVLCAAAMSRYGRRLSSLGREQAAAGRELAATVQETLSAVELIKLSSMEAAQGRTLRERIERHRSALRAVDVRVRLIQPLSEALGITAIALIVFLSLAVYDQSATAMTALLLPFCYILVRLVPTVTILNQSRAAITTSWPAVRHVHDLLRTDDKTFMTDGDRPFDGPWEAIHLQKVSFSYHNDDTFALRDVTFDIPRCQTTAVVGRSGSGKSTLVKLLARLYDPQHGAIVVGDVPLRALQLSGYRHRLAVVSQETFVFNNTAMFNIAFGAPEPTTLEQVQSAARRARAHEFIEALPKGYDTVLGDRGVRLSGGQRQRIAIARAILRNPEVLILDEATSALDTRTEREVQEAIQDLSVDRTVVVIAHRLSTVANADQVVVLEDGRVVECGRPVDLMKIDGGLYRASIEQQHLSESLTSGTDSH